MNNIRNFCIIAHIDHGKSTLADRFLELTGTIDKRKMKEQVLDQMDLERERGITIKLQPVRMIYHWQIRNSKFEIRNKFKIQNSKDKNSSKNPFEFNPEFNSMSEFILNLIDTPGHVDFSYEVSRSLAAVEGAILLVDATQGIQAQTLANYYLAKEQGLTIIPVLNKIDLPNARIDEAKKELIDLLKCDSNDILDVSAKTGQGVEKLLQTVIKKIPPPKVSDLNVNVFQSLIFDSQYNDYKGVIAFVRIFNGEVKRGDKIYLISTKKQNEVIEVGYFKPELKPSEKLLNGEIGYIMTGLKDLSSCQVGDTITNYVVETQNFASLQLPGYKQIKPMVFAGIFCKQGVEYKDLRQGLEKIKLTDASLFFEPESSPALGPGFRCGFLGLLHLEIIQERLKREYGLELVITTPNVAHKIILKRFERQNKNEENSNNKQKMDSSDKKYEKSIHRNPDQSWDESGQAVIIHSPQELPNPNEIEEILEPWVKMDIITPQKYLGVIMKLTTEKRGVYLNTEYLSSDRVILHYQMPLSSILTDFYDKLKSVSSGYASLNYELIEYRPCQVERLDILVADELIDSLATIVYKDKAYQVARKIVDTLKDVLPRQMFEVKIQAVLGYQNTGKSKSGFSTKLKAARAGGKIIAAARILAMRKDVTAKLYGGDVTRKLKLLEKQKKGKKKMRERGRVEIPTETYLAVLKR